MICAFSDLLLKLTTKFIVEVKKRVVYFLKPNS